MGKGWAQRLDATAYDAWSLLRDHGAAYVRIARPDHWIKNIFVLPGAAAAAALVPSTGTPGEAAAHLTVALVSVCLAASANYTINEYLDSESDRHHPVKRSRPGASGKLDQRCVGLQYVVLATASLAVASILPRAFVLTVTALLSMGVIYNAKPVRSKDRAYVDVLSESVNNPLRFLVGWFALAPLVLPPLSALLAYWMGGAFLMAIKRYSEYRRIGDPTRAALYRRSFGIYSELSLLLSAFFYAICSAFFIGVFLIKYRVGLVLTFPMFAALFTTYLGIGTRRDSAAQAPERLWRETRLLALAAATFVLAAVLFMVDVPILHVLTDSRLLAIP